MELISVAEAAEILGVTKGRVRQLVVEQRILIKQRFGTALAFDAAEVRRFAQKERRPGPRPRKKK